MEDAEYITTLKIPAKYHLLEEFVIEMVHKFEKAEAKYGLWNDIGKYEWLADHMAEEYRELLRSAYNDSEAVDVANMAFLIWAFCPTRPFHLKTGDEQKKEAAMIQKMADELGDFEERRGR